MKKPRNRADKRSRQKRNSAAAKADNDDTISATEQLQEKEEVIKQFAEKTIEKGFDFRFGKPPNDFGEAQVKYVG